MVALERGGRSLVTFETAVDSDVWIEPLMELVKDRRLRKLEIGKVDGVPIRETPFGGPTRGGRFHLWLQGHAFPGLISAVVRSDRA